MKLQKLGGYAAIAFLPVYIIQNIFNNLLMKRVGIVVGTGDMNNPVKMMNAYSAARPGFLTASSLTILWVLLLLVVSLALYERMHANAPNLTRIMLIAASVSTAMLIACEVVWLTAVRVIAPTQDASAYRAMDAVASGLSAMGNFASEWVFLFLGCAVLKTGAFSKIPGWLYLLGGILFIPFIEAGLFANQASPVIVGIMGGGGLLMPTVGLVWIGIALLREKQPQPALKEMVAAN